MTGERVEPDRCPSCGGEPLRIVYGLIEDERLFAGQRVAFGGCCVAPNDPAWRCDVCGHEWGRRIEDEDWLTVEEPEEGSFSATLIGRPGEPRER